MKGARKLITAHWRPLAALTAMALIVAVPLEAQSRPDIPLTPFPEDLIRDRRGPERTVIGRSVEDRPLEVYRFGDGPSKRMIVAGIHGGYEWNTIELGHRLLSYLEENPQVVPDDVTLYLLPALNPDGEARSHGYEGRANANGVDLNRNFPHNWQAEWDPAGCWRYLPISGGAYPLSEPEPRALVRFILSEHIELLISYHSAALGIFAGGRPERPGSIRLAEEISQVTDYPYPPLETGCEYTGQLTDWAAANGVSAVDIELSTHHSLDYEVNLEILSTFLNHQP